MVGDKKILILQIFKILKDHSDVKNPLSRQQIIDCLEKEYDQKGIDGRTINSNIDILNEYLDDAIEYRTEKMKSKGSTIEKRYDYYLIRDFDESELRLIIDSVLSSKSIPENQCEQLIEKLRKEANSKFKYQKNSIKKYTSGLKANDELFLSIEVLGEAIEEKKKVEFKYYDYDINKKLIPRVDKEGKERIYKLTPLRMVVNNGRYYLFGVPDIYDDLSIYRIDKIKGAKVLDEAGKSKDKIKELKSGMELGKHIAEHIFMTLGPSETIIFEFNKWWISFVIDWFGKEIELKMKDANTCIGRVKVNIKSFVNWLMMCSFIEAKVTEPKAVVDEVKARAKQISKLYSK
ncbi:MAG: WYL domain-containing protein [Lachnospiraceae bacterium]|nr:WYL domain-containing protein [Lachnospiraceae bacterium]